MGRADVEAEAGGGVGDVGVGGEGEVGGCGSSVCDGGSRGETEVVSLELGPGRWLGCNYLGRVLVFVGLLE